MEKEAALGRLLFFWKWREALESQMGGGELVDSG
jgi:hypothetical protein